MKRTVIAVVALLLLASTAWAQSLADLAKKEEERRKAIKEPAKVVTNEDLKKFGRVTPAETPKTDAAATDPAKSDTAKSDTAKTDTAKTDAAKTDAAKTDAAKTDAAKTDAAKTDADKAKDEGWWRSRMTEARAALERSRLMSDALQSRINQLWADFTAAAGPIRQKELGEERQKAIDELDRLKKEIEAQKQAIADIETEARRAGVPPGWLR